MGSASLQVWAVIRKAISKPDSLPADTTPQKEYYNIMFASEKDTTCGMPLSAGIGDTLNWNNKVYGFCSKRCKDAFVETLKKEKKL